MKIKQHKSTYEEVMARPLPTHSKPESPNRFFQSLMHILSAHELKKVHFSCSSDGMERLSEGENALYLMNHSCFTDLMVATDIIYPKPFHIICTSDGFVGKSKLMRKIGCVPTHKFVTDPTLVKDMYYIAKNLGESILMYPEASYSFDGTATPLPDSIGKLVKLLNIPVVMIQTYGAFLRDPLYNNLQIRKVRVTADVKYVLSPEEIAGKSAEELTSIIKALFTFDNFRWQQVNEVTVREHFRADYLNRVLYKCPHCLKEGGTVGSGKTLTCAACGKKYELTVDGYMKALKGDTEFSHIPDWYAWEREEVKNEILSGSYSLDIPVKIGVLMDESSLYFIGEGRLTHSTEGFHLTGCNGKLDYYQKPSASYSLYSDYYWYEIGDMICIGDMKYLYYCFPIDSKDVVAKTRLATEELYKLECK